MTSLKKLKSSRVKHSAEVSKQTGFPSPATHYLEHTVDLHEHLVKHPDATFFVRVEGDELSEYNMHHNDILIIDRSLSAKQNTLLLIVEEGEFKIKRFSTSQKTPYVVWGVVTYIIHAAL
ncbi:S24 family peptidase [Winogradskyella sp. A3E31]|uniref:S24 family peptidase n=1 Tax=Winogradskyella sp. A3E31 TaxID=3349637 RepID=UPI00398B6366